MRLPQNPEKLVPIPPAPMVSYVQKQRRRMRVALVLLLFALLLVFIRDRRFWFPASDSDDQSAPVAAPPPPVEPPAHASPAQPRRSPSSRPRSHAASVPTVPPPTNGEPQAIVTNRAVLPPLQVEVVAGDQRRTVHPGSTSINVDMEPHSSANGGAGSAESSATVAPGSASDAAERVRISPDPSRMVSNPVRPNYPTLARQMKVQGSVVLQALIGKSGSIQDLQVLSGPSILSSAAQEAVKQWRFKPYYQNGQPVETQCSITVNFTISTQ
jgi:periplasmic protein TonB